ncbi:MAG: hypothetical protein R3E88_07995 [Myxococcota bacterium]
MDTADQLEALLELAREAGLEVRSVGARPAVAGEAPPTSAVCRVRSAVWVVLSAADPPDRHIAVLGEALRRHASGFLEDRFLPPALRALLQDPLEGP